MLADVPLSTTTRGSAAQTASDFGEYFAEVSKSIALAAPGGPVSIIVSAIGTTLVQLVEKITEGVLRRKEAQTWAYQIGIPEAGAFPAFVVDVQRMSFSQRMALGDKLLGELRTARTEKRRAELQAKVDALTVLLGLEYFRERGAIPPAAPSQVLVREYEVSPVPVWIPWVLGGTLAAIGVWYALE